MRTLLIVLSLSAAAGRVAAEPNDLAARFLADYQPHVPAMAERYGRQHVEYDLSSPSADRKGQVSKVEVRLDGPRYLIRQFGLTTVGEKPAANPSPVLTMVRNTKYYFELEHSDRGPVLRKVNVFRPGEDGPAGDQVSRLLYPYVSTALEKPYRDVIASPRFTCTGYGPVTVRGQAAVQVAGVHTTTFPEGGDLREQYTFYFLPAAGWVCLGFKAKQYDSADEFEDVYLYKSYAGPLPELAGWESWSRPTGSRATKYATAAIRSASAESRLTDDDCRLTAFGLPEPAGVQWDRGIPVYAWMLAAAAGFGGAAMLFRRLHGRQPAPAGAASGQHLGG